MTPKRRYDFDALRALAVLVLLLYHSTRAFDSESWHLKSPDVSRALELFGYTLTPWRLSLLFLISGAGTWFALRTRTPGAYLRERIQRLLLPLGVGMVVVIPPQVYLDQRADRRLCVSPPSRRSVPPRPTPRGTSRC